MSARPVRRRRRWPAEDIPETIPPSVLGTEAMNRRERARYRGTGVRVGASDVVHEVRWYAGPGGLEVPGPRCGAGGADPGRLSPARSGRTCQRCERMRGPGETAPRVNAQDTLF